MRIAFVLSDLNLGGAQRVAAILAKGMAERGNNVALITLDDSPSLFPLEAGIERIALGLTGSTTGAWAKISANLRRLAALRRALNDFAPDVAISFVTPVNVMALLAGLGTGLPIIVSERSDPRTQPWPLAWRLLRRLTYPLAAALVMQTRDAAAALPPHRRKVVIPNPVPPLAIGKDTSDLPRPRLLAAGRLTHQKGFDLLIEAFGKLAAQYPDWHLVIAGEGEERQALEAQRQSLGLSQRIHLPGFVADMGGLMAGSDLFVLPSRFEGFPNALCEAMAAGLAVIAADCPSGPGDILRSGEDGLLVEAENPTVLAQVMDRMMSDGAARHAMGDKARAISNRFDVARVLDRWFTLISDCRKP